MNDYPTTLRVIAAFKAGEDLAERLGSAVKAQNAMADALRNAADEIERLQNEMYAKSDGKHGVTDMARATLTAAEREAIQWARKWITTMVVPSAGLAHAHAESLRKLLERMK
jgi:hypothetical protein